jgi:hypothetical protein
MPNSWVTSLYLLSAQITTNVPMGYVDRDKLKYKSHQRPNERDWPQTAGMDYLFIAILTMGRLLHACHRGSLARFSIAGAAGMASDSPGNVNSLRNRPGSALNTRVI